MNATEIFKSLKSQLRPTKNEWKPELKIAKTIEPKEKVSFNEVYLNAHNELNKTKLQ